MPPLEPRKLRLHTPVGRLLRRLLARRRLALLELAPDAAQDLVRIAETRREAPLLLTDARALHLLACVRAARKLGGAMAEAGVLWGGSARLICEAKGDRPLHLFDVFETLQSGSVNLEAKPVRDHFGRVHSSLAAVRQLLEPYQGVHFHPGLFPESAKAVRDERFCFVHLDLDLAQGTRDAVEFFWPRLLPGGILLGDDYNLPEVRDAFQAKLGSAGTALIELPWHQIMVVKS